MCPVELIGGLQCLRGQLSVLESDQVNGVNATTLEESMEGSLVPTKGPAICFHVSVRR